MAAVTDNFLTFSEYAAVKRCALEHPKLRVRGGLNDAGFSKTRGFVVKFNLEGVDKFQTPRLPACFAPVFEKLRLPEANAFVMNVLLCELGDYDQYNADELSVGMHLDTTVGFILVICYRPPSLRAVQLSSRGHGRWGVGDVPVWHGVSRVRSRAGEEGDTERKHAVAFSDASIDSLV